MTEPTAARGPLVEHENKTNAAGAVPHSHAANHIKRTETAQFVRYVLPYNSELPRDIDFSGSISINHDRNHVGWLHILVWIVQKIHSWVFGRTIDADFVHGLIITGRDRNPAKPNNLLIAHSAFTGIKSASHDYLHDKDGDITEMYIYVPKDPRLRQLLSKFGQQTVYIPEKFLEREQPPRAKPSFSICDMLESILHNRPLTKNSRRGLKEIARNANVVADLILGNQLLNKRETARPYFCTAYAYTVLQGSMLVASLTDQEIEQIKQSERGPRTRAEVAAIIYQRLRTQNPLDALSKTFWTNPLCQVNSRFLLSGYAQQVLDANADKSDLPPRA